MEHERGDLRVDPKAARKVVMRAAGSAESKVSHLVYSRVNAKAVSMAAGLVDHWVDSRDAD